MSTASFLPGSKFHPGFKRKSEYILKIRRRYTCERKAKESIIMIMSRGSLPQQCERERRKTTRSCFEGHKILRNRHRIFQRRRREERLLHSHSQDLPVHDSFDDELFMSSRDHGELHAALFEFLVISAYPPTFSILYPDDFLRSLALIQVSPGSPLFVDSHQWKCLNSRRVRWTDDK